MCVASVPHVLLQVPVHPIMACDVHGMPITGMNLPLLPGQLRQRLECTVLYCFALLCLQYVAVLRPDVMLLASRNINAKPEPADDTGTFENVRGSAVCLYSCMYQFLRVSTVACSDVPRLVFV